MRRLAPLVLVVTLVAAAAAFIPARASANGCMIDAWDPATNTYTLADAAHLRRFGQGGCDFTATVRLGADIDLTGGGDFTPIGSLGNPFTGRWEGNGHTITGLQLTAPGADGFGLFGYTDGASIRDTSITGTLIGDSVGQAGLLVGSATDTTISGVHVTGTVRGSSAVGGLIGSLSGGSVTDSSASAVVTADIGIAGGLVGGLGEGGLPTASLTRVQTAGSVTADASVAGGIVGTQINASLDQAQSTATVRARDAGGLVGIAQGWAMPASITDSSSTGAVIGTPGVAQFVGGIVGSGCDLAPPTLVRNYFAGTLTPNGATSGGIIAGHTYCVRSLAATGTSTGNLWNSDTTGPAGDGGDVGVGRTSAQMKQIGTYTDLGWSIVNGWEPTGAATWAICSQVNDGYPFLPTLQSAAPCAAPVVPDATTTRFTAVILTSRTHVQSGRQVRVAIRVTNTGTAVVANAVACIRLPRRLVIVRAPHGVRHGRRVCFRITAIATHGSSTNTVVTDATGTPGATVQVTGNVQPEGGGAVVGATPARVRITPPAPRPAVTG